jgi:multiple sugar transport system ATP-binding protein
VAVLRDGVLQQVDTPAQIYDRPANLFVAGFIGSPPMNLAQATIERGDGGLEVRFGSQAVALPAGLVEERGLESLVGKPVIAGIRPEDLDDSRDGGSERSMLGGKVERVEALGANLLVYFTIDAAAPAGGVVAAVVAGESLESAPLIAGGGTSFCATFEPRSFVKIGEPVQATVDAERLHFFDPETQVAL